MGDDVNAALLDRLAETTRAVSAYVRPAENIEHKVSSLYAKMSSPVLTNLKLATTADVKLNEVYPPDLPDLFHGGQLVVIGRFTGKGSSAIKLTGKVGKEEKEFVFDFTFPEKTGDDREFVESLWARRKVGYMLDQIRLNGEKKELIDEVIALAKKYGITTPYTSYLIVPDGPIPSGRPGGPVAFSGPRPFRGQMPNALKPPASGAGGVGGAASKPLPVLDFARKPLDDRAKEREGFAEKELAEAKPGKGKGKGKHPRARRRGCARQGTRKTPTTGRVSC